MWNYTINSVSYYSTAFKQNITKWYITNATGPVIIAGVDEVAARAGRVDYDPNCPEKRTRTTPINRYVHALINGKGMPHRGYRVT